jgi:hypothetical protein
VERDTLCKSTLLTVNAVDKGHKLHVSTAEVERDALCTFILLVEQGILAK